MSLPFAITSTTRDFDAPDGYVYRAITALDFHQGWYTTLSRTTREANGYPNWSNHGITQSLTVTGEWSPKCAARPVLKFMNFDEAEYHLAGLLSRADSGNVRAAE
jgi:hypothetical protein